jgi:YD repeat-containing protein
LCGVIVVGAGFAASQTPTPAPSPEPAPTAAADPVERAAWQGELTGSSLLEVSNPFGDLRLRYGGSGRTVEVTVALQQLDPAGSRLELVVNEKADPATVRVVRSAAAEPPSATHGENQSRADMVVLVPRGIAVRASTDRGLAESVGLESDVELETSAGKIRVRSTRGRVTAISDRGEISAMLLAGVTKAPQRFSTVTGSIEVWVSDTCAFDIALATSGRLITDFSMQVEHHDREEPDKVGTVRVGAGGQPLELRSRRGDLSIRRLVEPDQLAVGRTEGEAEP